MLPTPIETTKFTAEPEITLVPADGFSLITRPDGIDVLACVAIVPTVRPVPVIAAVAAARASPTTLGTATCTGVAPLLMVRLTGVPEPTFVPAEGLWLIMLPDGTVALLVVDTVPSTRAAPVIAVVAAACVSPTTFGIATCGGPLLTVRFTADPEATIVAAAGLSIMTLPAGTVALLAIVTVPTTRPASVIEVVAAACAIPATLGTAT